MKTFHVALVILAASCLLHTGCHVNDHNISEKFRPVIEHYRNDPVRRDAAKFLLQNIRYHRSFVSRPYLEYCREVDSIFKAYDDDEEMAVSLAKVRDKYDGRLRLDKDTELLSPEYLMESIDSNVSQWQRLPWLKGLSKEDFHEYYLPYKCVEGQPVERWKEAANLSGKGDMPVLEREENGLFTARMRYKAIHEYLRSVNTMTGPEPPLDYFTLCPEAMSHAHGTNCFGRSYAEMMFFRANGLPVATEYTPCWLMHGGQHSWVALIGGSSADQSMEPWTENYDPGYFKDNSFIPSKVYRMGWSPRKILVRARKTGVKIPGELTHLFVKDVTDMYNKTSDISVRNRKFFAYVFLAVFDGNGWTPVDIAHSTFGYAHFRKTTKGAVYCIISEEGGQLSAPFHVDAEGKVGFFRYTAGKVHDMVLRRKFPQGRQTFKIRERVAGARILGSPDGRAFEEIGEIDPTMIVASQCTVASGRPLRYLKIVPGEEEGLDIAELYVFDTDGNRIFPSDVPQAMSDGDALSYENISRDEGVTLDLGKKCVPGHVSVIKRGDGNDIVPGHYYELFYNDGRRWASAGIQTASDTEIRFMNVPEGVPLFLKDCSGGSENALFIFENGQQYWLY